MVQAATTNQFELACEIPVVDKIEEDKVFLKDGWQCQVNNPHGVWTLGQILGASGGCCDLTSLPKLQSSGSCFGF